MNKSHILLTNNSFVNDLQDVGETSFTHSSSYVSPSHETMFFFLWIVVSLVCQSIDVFGVVTNILNIICFIKQGFNDPVNVSLMGLAVADLGCLSTLIWSNLSLNPSFMTLDLPFDQIEFQHLASTTPHISFARISSWITALITLERCLCITVPLKVKNIFTSKRVAAIILCIYIILIASVAPVYVVSRIGLKFFPSKNKTLLGLVYSNDREIVEKVSYVINNVVVPFMAFIVIILCTVILAFKLHKKTKWRMTSTATLQADNVSSRNLRVAKMVVMISTLFIVCLIPVSINFIAMTVEPELSADGKYLNILIIIMGIGFLLESINSAVNIFIYYHMSSRFRTVFLQIFCLGDKKRESTTEL